MKLLSADSVQKYVKQAGFALPAVPWVEQGEFQGIKVALFLGRVIVKRVLITFLYAENKMQSEYRNSRSSIMLLLLWSCGHLRTLQQKFSWLKLIRCTNSPK